MKRKNPNQSKNSNYSLAHVLYQKLGNEWYAFTEVDGDCFMSKVDPKLAEVEFAKGQREELDAKSGAHRKRRAA